MKRHLVLAGAVAVIAVVLGTFVQSNNVAQADTSTVVWDVKFCAPSSAVIGSASSCAAVDVMGGGGAATGYDYVSYLELDPAGGPGGTPTEPFFDLATTAWDSTLNVNNSGGSTAPIGAIVGEIDFHLESNAPGTVSLVTGGVDPCGTTPAGVGGTGSILAGVRAPTTLPNMSNPAQFYMGGSYVQSFDDDDGDLLEYVFGTDPNGDGASSGALFEVAETQEDGVDLNSDGDFTDANEIAPDGILDGAQRMPDFLPRLYAAAGIGPVVNTGDAGRGYAVADVLAGVSQVDVNFILLDVTAIGVPGYISVTTIGIVDPNAVYNPATAAQTLQTCTPFQSETTVFGITRDNPGSAANEGGVLIREVTGDFSYAITVSTTEDYDGDGVADGIDRCDTDAAAGTNSGDGDEVSGTCDNKGGSNDNCDAGGSAPACPRNDVIAGAVSEGSATGALCTGTVEAVGAEGGTYETGYPWDLDQDVDCDGAANFADNCPTTYNPSQKDSDADGVGNACDPAFSENGCSGDSGLAGTARFNPCWTRSQGHDHDQSCYDPVSAAAGATEDNDGGAGTTCTVSQDSSDDGVLDSAAAFFPGLGPTGPHEDINSDADNDGCPDKDEVDGDAECNGDPYNPDDNTNGTIDGAEDRNSNGTADWRDSVVNEPQTASNVFNSDGSPDSDGDGCSNRRENLGTDSSGGNRDALNPYDFLDVPGPADGGTGTDGKPTLSAGSSRNKAVALTDVGVILGYVGRTSTNAGAAYYNGDLNNDGIADGRQMDRTAGAGNAETAGNLAISLTDVGIALDHVGDSCAGTP